MAVKNEKEVQVRPKFRLKENDYKRMQKVMGFIGMSMSQYVKLALVQYLKGDK